MIEIYHVLYILMKPNFSYDNYNDNYDMIIVRIIIEKNRFHQNIYVIFPSLDGL